MQLPQGLYAGDGYALPKHDNLTWGGMENPGGSHGVTCGYCHQLRWLKGTNTILDGKCLLNEAQKAIWTVSTTIFIAELADLRQTLPLPHQKKEFFLKILLNNL